MNVDEDDGVIMTASEYSTQVANWLLQAHQWQNFALGFPSFVAHQLSLQQQNLLLNNGHNAGGSIQTGSPFFNGRGGNNTATAATATTAAAPRPIQYREFRIPPVWKRVAAETLDFLILFLIKILTFVTVDYFGLVDLEKYDVGFLALASGKDLDYNLAVDLTSDILTLEMLHRLMVCTFETFFTYQGSSPDKPGGATPGKKFMGLRIFSCDAIVQTADPDVIQITPAENLGIFWATTRSVLKNMTMAFVIPVCFTFFVLPYKRGIYDVFSRSIVVEVDPPRFNRQRQPNQ